MLKTPEEILGKRTTVFVICPEGTFKFPVDSFTRGTLDRNKNPNEISFTPLVVKDDGRIMFQDRFYVDHLESSYKNIKKFEEDRDLQIKEIESKGTRWRLS